MHKRKKLFIVFTILFFISVPVVIIYTQGYRLDTEKLELVKTGGIDLEITPINSSVYLNGELERETSFLFRNAIFRNILPGEYNIGIEKDGYHGWQKNTVVEPGHVEKFAGVMLFPLETGIASIKNDAISLNIAPDNRTAIIKAPAPATTEGAGAEQLILTDLNSGSQNPILTLRAGEQVRQIEWSSNSSVFHILIDGNSEPLFYTGARDNGTELTNHTTFLSRSYPAVFNRNNIIVSSSESPNTIYLFRKEIGQTLSLDRIDLQQRTIRPNVTDGILGFNIIDDNMFFLDSEGTIEKLGLSSETLSVISPTAIAKPNIIDSKIIAREDQKAIVVINNGSVFLWQEGESLNKISNNVDNVSFSPDGKKLLMWNSEKVVIYWLEDVFGPPQKEAGDIETIEISGVNSALWVNIESTHIALQTNERIIFTELDSRDRRNTVEYEIATDHNAFALDLSRQVIYTLLEDRGLSVIDYK
ncbi:MAG: hypothetical protein WDZ39_00010 [Candidatus Spechtbacterales bacterium]